MFSFLTRPAAPRLTIADIAALVAKGDADLVDVRELAEVKASGKAKGAQHIPLGILGVKADPSAPDCKLATVRPVFVYCASGGRSGMAAQMLTRLGYAQVTNIGGLGDWVAGGGQVERA